MSNIYRLLIFTVITFFITTAITYSQATRKVLFEEGTNASCGPCAANNPILKAFLDANENNCLAIKYHASWPGVDPMYSANPTQNTERIVNYYNMGASGVPYCNCDGVIQDIWPFSIAAFTNAMNTRLGVPTPVSITVADQRIAGDSIKATVTVQLLSNLPAGTYKLRVMAIERKIVYTTPPGTNGETVFEHVFRWAYPGTAGVDAPTTTGTYSYVYTYKRLSNWVDTSVFTTAFVQNDVNKEVINAGRGYYSLTGVNNNNQNIPESYYLSQNYPNPFNPVTVISFELPKAGNTTLKVYDMLGNLVRTLVAGNLNAGPYKVDFNSSGISSGVYVYKLESGDYSAAKKMILIK